MQPYAKYPPSALLASLVVAGALIGAPEALARSSDRNQPMDIAADQQTGSLDESTPTVLSGNVSITQGTLAVSAARAVINSRDGAISRVVLTGGPARLKQQLDNGTPMSAAASNIDYNLGTEVVIFTGNVVIQQPRGTLSGARVVYNMRTGNVSSGSSGSEGKGQVKMRIMPRNAAAPAKTPTDGD